MVFINGLKIPISFNNTKNNVSLILDPINLTTNETTFIINNNVSWLNYITNLLFTSISGSNMWVPAIKYVSSWFNRILYYGDENNYNNAGWIALNQNSNLKKLFQ